MRINILRHSFKYRLIAAFCGLSIIPFILVMSVSSFRFTQVMQSNIDSLEKANLLQTRKIIRIKLDFYEDLLSQVYADDRIVQMVNHIDDDNDVEFYSGQLRRLLHSFVYTMPYICSITIITSNGKIVFDDLLTGFNTRNSWLDVSNERPGMLFDSISSTNQTQFFPSERASFTKSESRFLFHMSHRLVNYNNINEKKGVVILSIDENLLNEICKEIIDDSQPSSSMNRIFIIDKTGRIVSDQNRSNIGQMLDLSAGGHDRNAEIRNAVIKLQDSKLPAKPINSRFSAYELVEDKTGWSIIMVKDQSEVYKEISNLQRIMLLIALFSVFALITVIYFITGRLTGSINGIVAALQKAGQGDLTVRILYNNKMPSELKRIAETFNSMIIEIDALIDEVRVISEKKRNAEIATLEAHVNPHFLYNALDTINWMAIDKDELEISNSINSLAQILRYSIDSTIDTVEIHQEVEWLRAYIAFQRIRLKDSFECTIGVDPSAVDCHIHKLLIQPFIENAIVHGFKKEKKNFLLDISIIKQDGYVNIKIADNGAGIDAEKLKAINDGKKIISDNRDHIGISTAIERIKIYYGDSAFVKIQSQSGEGTVVEIIFPAV